LEEQLFCGKIRSLSVWVILLSPIFFPFDLLLREKKKKRKSSAAL
jgi:hypothetical protein